MRHTGKAKLGARVRPGWFVQTHEHPELLGRTLLEILHRGDGRPDGREGMGREQAARVLDRYELAHASEQRFESLSGGQQARFQILLLELSGATLLLLDEPTDNLDVQSAEALEDGLEAFDGTVLAVTHDRWFARGFDRFLVFGADGDVYESDEPVWDEGRVARTDERAEPAEITDLDPFDDDEFDEFHAVFDAAQTFGREATATPWELDELRATMQEDTQRKFRHGIVGRAGGRIVVAASSRAPLLDNLEIGEPAGQRAPRAPAPRLRHRDAGPLRGGRPRARPHHGPGR